MSYNQVALSFWLCALILGYAVCIFHAIDAKYLMFCVSWQSSLKGSATPEAVKHFCKNEICKSLEQDYCLHHIILIYRCFFLLTTRARIEGGRAVQAQQGYCCVSGFIHVVTWWLVSKLAVEVLQMHYASRFFYMRSSHSKLRKIRPKMWSI